MTTLVINIVDKYWSSKRRNREEQKNDDQGQVHREMGQLVLQTLRDNRDKDNENHDSIHLFYALTLCCYISRKFKFKFH